MMNLPKGNIRPEEDERLRAWRAERARIAEAEKRQRIAARQQELEAEKQREADERKARVDALLPEIGDIQAARALLAARARRARRGLVVQFLACVIVPTALALGYMIWVATPLYKAQAVVAVSQPASTDSGELGLLQTFGNSGQLREIFQAHEFLRSGTLMDALDADSGIMTLMSSEAMDPLRRVRDMPGLGITRHDMFARFLRSSVNIQNGLMTLHVHAPQPEQAMQVAQLAIDLTAAHINGLAKELVAERVAEANRSVEEARQSLRDARTRLTQLQVESGEIDPRAQIESVIASIDRLTLNAQELRAQIEHLEVAGSGGNFQAIQLREREALLHDRIDLLRQRLVQGVSGAGSSLNALLIDYEQATLEMRIAEEALTTALQTAERTWRDAALSRHFFQVVVPPSPSPFPTAPNALRTGLLIFIGLLAAFSILRLVLVRR